MLSKFTSSKIFLSNYPGEGLLRGRILDSAALSFWQNGGGRRKVLATQLGLITVFARVSRLASDLVLTEELEVVVRESRKIGLDRISAKFLDMVLSRPSLNHFALLVKQLATWSHQLVRQSIIEVVVNDHGAQMGIALFPFKHATHFFFARFPAFDWRVSLFEIPRLAHDW